MYARLHFINLRTGHDCMNLISINGCRATINHTFCYPHAACSCLYTCQLQQTSKGEVLIHWTAVITCRHAELYSIHNTHWSHGMKTTSSCVGSHSMWSMKCNQWLVCSLYLNWLNNNTTKSKIRIKGNHSVNLKNNEINHTNVINIMFFR